MSVWNGAILGFCLFIGLLAWFIGWALHAAQRMLDRHWDDRMSEEELRQAMKRWPP